MDTIIIEVKYKNIIVAKKKFRSAERAAKWLVTADCTDSYNMVKKIKRVKKEKGGEMKVFPRTIEELNSITTMRAIRSCILDTQDGCTNVYSPKYKELTKLYSWVSKNIPDERVHGKQISKL